MLAAPAGSRPPLMNHPLLARLAPLLALSWIGSRVAAQPAPGDEVVDDLDLMKLLNVEVSTATKTAESLDDAPAVITVVTRDDIQRWGYQSLAEVLQHTVGFYVIDDHILPNAGVRGMTGGLGAESGAIKVMIDGRSVAYRATSGNWLGIELIPLSSIAQIEIIRGPASALYGADAFLGVVNIITLSPQKLRPVQARVTAGAMNGNPAGRIDVVGGSKIGDFDWLLGAAGEYTDRTGLKLPAESALPTLPADVGTRRTTRNLQRRSLVLQSRLGYRPSTTDYLVLSAYASGIERGGDFAHWAQLTSNSDQSVGTIVALNQLRLNLDGALRAADNLELALQSTFFQGGLLPTDRVEIASGLFYVERKQSYRGIDSSLEARWTPDPRFNAIVGVETLYDREQLPAARRVNRVTGESFADISASDSRSAVGLTNLGGYVSLNYKLFDPWLKLTGGARYDLHSQYGGQAAGRVGLTSRLSPAISAKLLYGNAFKAPSPYLLYAAPLRPGDVVGNERLKPQHIHTLESQLSWKPGRFFGLTSGVSYSWLLDKAEFTPQGINQTARNVASQRSLSWETRADLRHYNDYVLYASFELVRSQRELGQDGYAAALVGTENVVYPPWIARGGVSVGLPFWSDVPLELSSEAMFVGPRRAADTTLVELGRNVHFRPYLMLDAALATRAIYLAPGHESRVALRARNLLGATGPDPGFSGFEYPLSPTEVFLEFHHTY
jgi:outer membrane receptor for ferrienterochelin and colicins